MKEIPLTQGKLAMVDDEDFDRLMCHKWCFRNTGYAARGLFINGKRTTMLMHREILYAKPGEVVDHRDANKLDNRKSNIRKCSIQQNVHNNKGLFNRKGKPTSSGYKGVSWSSERGKWLAQIVADGKHEFLGRFYFEESAALAYNEAAVLLYREFAQLNVLKPETNEEEVT